MNGYQVKIDRYKATVGDKTIYAPTKDLIKKYLFVLDRGNTTYEELTIDPKDEWFDGIIVFDTSNPRADAANILQNGEDAYNNKLYIGDKNKAISKFAEMSISGETFGTDNKKIELAAIFEDWVEGAYSVGDIRNANGQTWECFQEHDTASNPDIVPGNSAWYTFWRPLHGNSVETARPFVPVQGSHDMYRTGEYMVYTDGEIYKCLSDTNFSPDDYAQAWEKVEV